MFVLNCESTGHDWLTALVGVDEIALEFHETHQKHVIQSCDDIHELKQIASALVSCHFAMKRMLGHYMLEGMPRMDGG